MKNVPGSKYKWPWKQRPRLDGAVRSRLKESIQEGLKSPGQKMLEGFWVAFFINDNVLSEHNLSKEDEWVSIFLRHKQSGEIQNHLLYVRKNYFG